MVCLGVSSHLLLLPSLCPLLSPLSSSVARAGLGLLVFGLLQLPPSLGLLLTHLSVGYLARPAYVRLHLLLTSLLSITCLGALVLQCLLLQDSAAALSSPSPLCLPQARAASWLPALLPLLASALLCHLLTLLLLSTTALTAPCEEIPRLRPDLDKTLKLTATHYF